jgi:hypothetical protein
VRTMLRVRITELYTSATGGEALTILRNDRAFRTYYNDAASERAFELFTAGNSKAISGVERKFFAALADEATDDRLRETANRSENVSGGSRGELLRAVIERSRGATTPYYSSLDAELRTAVDELSARLFTTGAGEERFSAEEQSALLANAGAFETYMNYVADQELITSGLFEELEGQLRAAVARSADASLRDYVSANPNSSLRAYAEQLYVSAGLQGALSAPAATAMGGHPALAAAVDQAIAGMNPQYRELLLEEQSLITRFLEEFIESDQERRHIRDMLRDPSLSHPDQGLALHHESTKTLTLTAAKKAGTADALLRSIEEQRRYFAELNAEQSREIAVSREVKAFGQLKGNEANFEDSRFAQYRTYAGTEREHQEEEYTRYTAGGGTEDFEEWIEGRYIEVENMNIADVEGLLNGDYDSLLTSDNPADLMGARVENGTDTATTTDDESVDVRKIRTVGQINTMTFASNAEEMRYTYMANLANNYLEAATKLNASLNSVWIAGELANERETASAAIDIRTAVKATYDPNNAAPADPADLDVLTTEKQAATAQLANYGETQLSQAQNEINQLTAQSDDAGQKYADAARRKQLDGIRLVQYAEDTFTAALDELEAANLEMEGAELASNAERTDYDTLMSDYTDKLDELSGYFRHWQTAENEKEKRLAVLDYANTPYLAIGATDAGDTSGAQNQYDAALAALENANERLKEAGFDVQTEDRIADFAVIVAGLEGGTVYAPLSAAEQSELAELRDLKFREYGTLDAAQETRLTELTHREMYERYSDLIVARAEHIKHTMRMVRIEKAAAIIKSEIEEKRLIAEDKRNQFERSLDNNFGSMAPIQGGMTQDRVEQARMAVYQRLVSKMESGQPLYNEFRGWYYGSMAWFGQYAGVTGSALLNGGAMNPIGIATTFEIIGGNIDAAAIPPADAANFAIWQNNGGSLGEYNQFQSTYFGFLMSLMALDAATLEVTLLTAILGPILATLQGLSSVVPGAAIQAANMQAILTQAIFKQVLALLASIFTNFAAMGTANYNSVSAVRQKEIEYQRAQSELDYLTKAPDLDTVKERLRNYGGQNEDPEDAAYDLYQLTDEDLVYLLEMVGGSENWAGATPTAEERSESLDITGKQNDVEYRDSAGRRYDPTDYTTSPPAPLYDGSYGGYTRVLVQGHDRDAKTYRYFRLIAETADSQIAYDLGEVLDSMLNHGNALREDRRDAYINAGNAAATTDSTFVYRERDATYQSLFEAATNRTDGGREFAGYRTTYADYANNQNEVFERELLQRQQVQIAEWNLREQELNDRYAEWEERMNAIVTRGQSGWGNSENLFLQERREWEREQNEQRADAEALWAARVQEHADSKSDWETQIRAQTTEGNVTEALADAVADMNAQIATMNANTGAELEQVNLQAVINQSIQELRNNEPSEAEKLKKINESIEKFNTTIALNELTGTNLGSGLVALGGQFREEARNQRRDLEVFANAKIFEQYMQMVDDLLEQINAQNRATEAQTTADAIAEGYTKVGDFFIKAGYESAFGVLMGYQAFDGATAIREEQERYGAMHGVRAGGEPSAFDTQAITDWLQTADSIQVSAFFDYQQQAFFKVAASILGKGNSEQRSIAAGTDSETLGRLGVWIGKPADRQMTQAYIENAGNSFGGDQEAARNLALQNLGGYGELGTSQFRPSNIQLGFYTQLWWMSDYLGEKELNEYNNQLSDNPLSTYYRSVDRLSASRTHTRT